MTTPDLRSALTGLIDAVYGYSPRYDHDWRCELRTAEAGWVPGGPPVIDCECGFDRLGVAVRDAQDALAAQPEPLDAAWKAAEAAADNYRAGSFRGASKPESPIVLRRYGAGCKAAAEGVSASGPTPAAALLSLAAKLAEPTP